MMVAKEGGVVRASEVLHLTPQTISGQLRMLEDTLGAELFKRSGKSLVLTSAGRTALQYAEDIFLMGAELQNVIANQYSEEPLSLSVGITDAIPKLVAHALIEPALAHNPNVRIKCYENQLDNLLADLAIHKLDVIISDRVLPANSNVRAFNHRLGESDITLFATPELIAKYGPKFPASLQGAPVLLPSSDSAVRSVIDQWFVENQIRPNIVGEFEDSALMKAFGQGGLGIFPGPTVIQDELMRQYKVKPLGNMDLIKEQFFAISAERKLKHPALVAILDVAKQQVFAQ